MRQVFWWMIVCALLLGGWVGARPAAAAPTQQGSRTVRVDAVERSWIEATVDGSTAYAAVLEVGGSRTWSGRDITLRIGNAGGIRVTLDGEALGTLGGAGEVVERRWQATGTAPAPAPAPPTVPAPTVAAPAPTAVAPAPTVAAPAPTAVAPAPAPSAASERGDVMERMTYAARYAAPTSPFYKKTWITYYGRPGVEVMGILGEFSIEELTPKLQEQAAAYDEANGPEVGVMPAFHLVYGMATKAPGDDGDYLAFMTDEAVQSYIDAAAAEGFQVILDIQIGNLTPSEALSFGLPWLEYDNVHLALDPEFAMSHPNQERPGNPIGFVTAEQVNEAQRVMRDYMRDNDIPGRRVLVLHQFLADMIQNKEELARLYRIDLTLTADGWGGLWPKVGKYNSFMDLTTKFTGFKLFYRWDEPLLTERQVLGVDRPAADISFIDITPNLIIYQ